MATDSPPIKFDPRTHNPDGTVKSFKGLNHGGARPGAGRPPGSKNGPATRFKEVARSYTDPAMRELARIAGVLQRIDPDTGQPMVDKKTGDPIYHPGSLSDNARTRAIEILLERGWGKATQKFAGDEGEAPIRTENTNIRVERVIVGAPTSAQTNAAPANEARSDDDVDEEKSA